MTVRRGSAANLPDRRALLVRPTVADSRQHALPVGPFGPRVPGRVPLSPGADPGHPEVSLGMTQRSP